MGRYLIACSIGAVLTAIAAQASGAGLDGTDPLICATAEAFDCAPNSQCIRDSPEAVNLPRFIRLDFAGKRAFTRRLNGEERVAEIMSQQSVDGRLVLQGVQLGHGWSMAISQETGAMSLAVVGDEIGFVIFGTCTNL
jgi:hypothetical protein